MPSLILVVDSSKIREGKLDEVKAGVEDLVAFVEKNEAEPLSYDIYFNAAGTLMTVVQIHPDSASLERHFTVAGPVFRRFADLLTLVRIDVYGKATELRSTRCAARRSCWGTRKSSYTSSIRALADLRPTARSDGRL
jgi:hypothetical protein